MFGGGDSVYVAMYDGKGKLAPGVSTLKPVSLPIQDTYYAGCCYNMYWHVCVCIPPAHSSPNYTHGGLNLFVNKTFAASRGITCNVPNNQLERLHAPRWYEFAGTYVCMWYECMSAPILVPEIARRGLEEKRRE